MALLGLVMGAQKEYISGFSSLLKSAKEDTGLVLIAVWRLVEQEHLDHGNSGPARVEASRIT